MSFTRMVRVLFALFVSVASATAEYSQDGFVEVPGSTEFSGQVIVRRKQQEDLAAIGLNEREIAEVRQAAVAELRRYDVQRYEPLVDFHVVKVPAGINENAFIGELMSRRANPGNRPVQLFEWAEPNWTVYPIACPNDSNFGSQWHHDASHMKSCAAWDISPGSPTVTVAICDTGVQTDHPDLLLNRKEGYNAVDRVWESSGGSIIPVHPHGTQCTGCSAANGNNGVGVSGVGWNLSHRMMRVSNDSGGGASISNLVHAALTAVQQGDKVASVSYSGVNNNSVRTTATQIKGLGGLLVWAAGNDNVLLDWGDRDSDDVIVVGATTSSDVKSSFSNYGPSVDLVAPGSSVYTTTTGSSYASVSGTSFACPLTAGLVGLIWSANPSLTPDDVENVLKSGCDDLGTAGVDNNYGYGRINSLSSLNLASCSSDTDCDDSDLCTTDTCDLGTTTCSITPISCPPPNACTDSFCVDGSCVQEPIDCVDFDYCTIDSCDTAVGCTNTAKQDCNCNSVCEAGETCGSCKADCCDSFQLPTTFEGGVSQAGNMFDIVALNEVVITTFDIHSQISGEVTVEVWTRSGSYSGYQSSSDGWTQVLNPTAVVSQGSGVPTQLPNLNLPVHILAGRTQAFYVTLQASGMVYTGGSSVGSIYAFNDDLQMKEGLGVAYPFGTTYSPRVWNGIITYKTTSITTNAPTFTSMPSSAPSNTPTTSIPSSAPSSAPTASSAPSSAPSSSPTVDCTAQTTKSGCNDIVGFCFWCDANGDPTNNPNNGECCFVNGAGGGGPGCSIQGVQCVSDVECCSGNCKGNNSCA